MPPPVLDVIVSQPAELEADQVHPDPLITASEPLLAPAGSDTDPGVTVVVQLPPVETAAWVTVTVWPWTVMVAVRLVVAELGSAVTFT